ncbi:hypothetical protein FHR53_000979 [Xanthomonas arboricola]
MVSPAASFLAGMMMLMFSTATPLVPGHYGSA